MRKFAIAIAVLLLSFSSSLAIGHDNGNLSTKKVEVKLKKKPVKFEMNLDEQGNLLTVELNGSFDEYSSVSVTNQRGSEYFFQFVDDDSRKVVFNLSTLEKGTYFVVLNTDTEIRIKRFLINE